MADGFLRRFLGGDKRSRLTDDQVADRRAVLDHPIYEVVPLKSLDDAIAALPPASDVSVTCSPNKGIDATLDLCETIRELGHRPTPHLAARMVDPDGHLDRIVERLKTMESTRVFVIAGDAQEPHGPYDGAAPLIEDLLGKAPFLTHVGFASYPDGHALIDDDTLRQALHRKQAILREAGVEGHATTQMCFDAEVIRQWLLAERELGFDLPVNLGLAGVVDRARLVTMGMRLGVGTSLRYLSKNRSAIARLLTTSSYEPTDILDQLAGEMGDLGIVGMHLFTFNQVGATADWLAEQR